MTVESPISPQPSPPPRPMDWSSRRLNLKWYEYLWALVPMALAAAGGAIGGLCGGAAVLANLKIMQGAKSGGYKYLVTAFISLLSVGAYIGLSKVVVIGIGSGTLASIRVDQALESSPTFKAIRKADSAAYEKIREALIRADPKVPADFDTIAQPYATAMMRHYLPSASDTAIIDFTRVLTLEIDQIGSKDADACIAFIAPSPTTSPISVQNFLTPEIIQRDALVGAAIIESGSQAVVTVPTKSEVSGTLGEVIQKMTAKYGSDDMTMFAKFQKLDHKKFCNMTSDLYKTVLSLPIKEVVPLLRYMYFQNSAI